MSKSKKNKDKSGAFDFDDFSISFNDSQSSDIVVDRPREKQRKNTDDDDDIILDSDEDEFVFHEDTGGVLDGDYNDYMDVPYIEEEVDDPDDYGKSTKKGTGVVIEQIDSLFEGYSTKEKSVENVKIGSLELCAFADLDYESISKILSTYNYASRCYIKDFLMNKKIDILNLVHKESSPNIRNIIFGLFSPPQIFHTIMCKQAIEEKNIQLLVTIFVLKSQKMVKEIIQSYQKIFDVNLEDEINRVFDPMNEHIMWFINCDKYFHVVKDSEYFKEAERVFHIIKGRNITGLINFMVRFTPKCFQEICNKFYSSYGYTIINFLSRFVHEKDIIMMAEILQIAYLSPVSFYCRLLHNLITNPNSDMELIYFLVDLDKNGLETVMRLYYVLYEKFDTQKVALRYEKGIREFVHAYLSKYEI